MVNNKCPVELCEVIKSIPQLQFDGKKLVILLGLLGDFDSFEYARVLLKDMNRLKKSNIRIHLIGIGTNESLERFSAFTGFPKPYISVYQDSSLHKSLGLYSGLNLPISSYLNLILMCAGIGSPGTLKEVMRGYIGDNNSPQNMDDDEVIKILGLIELRGSFFKKFFGEGYLRPFELATIRLNNLIEVISNWKLYMHLDKHLEQRGATYLLDSNDEILHFHRSISILGFSEKISNPLAFLDKWIL